MDSADDAISLEINKRSGCFSGAELQFIREAIAEGHVNQTHSTDPILEYCHRRPLRSRIFDGGNLPQSIRFHFEAAHEQSRLGYHIATNRGRNQRANAPARITGKCRERTQCGDRSEESGKDLPATFESPRRGSKNGPNRGEKKTPGN